MYRAKSLENMGILKEVIVEPELEDPKEVLKKRIMVDGYTLWTKLDSPVVLALHIFTMQHEGIDTSSFRYEDLPDCPPDMVRIRRRTRKGRQKKMNLSRSNLKSQEGEICWTWHIFGIF